MGEVSWARGRRPLTRPSSCWRCALVLSAEALIPWHGRGSRHGGRSHTHRGDCRIVRQSGRKRCGRLSVSRLRARAPEAKYDAADLCGIADTAIRAAAVTKDNSADLINVALEELLESGRELLGSTMLDRMVAKIRAEVNRDVFAAGRITSGQRARLAELVVADPSSQRKPLGPGFAGSSEGPRTPVPSHSAAGLRLWHRLDVTGGQPGCRQWPGRQRPFKNSMGTSAQHSTPAWSRRLP